MGERFKLQADEYLQKVQTFKSSFDDAEISADVEYASKCSEIIIDKYVERANQLGELIKTYSTLLKKDGEELNEIAEDIMRQEKNWGQSILSDIVGAIGGLFSNGTGAGGGFSGGGGFGGGSGGGRMGGRSSDGHSAGGGEGAFNDTGSGGFR